MKITTNSPASTAADVALGWPGISVAQTATGSAMAAAAVNAIASARE